MLLKDTSDKMDEKEPYTEKLLSLSVSTNMRKVHSTVSLLDPVSKVLDIMIRENTGAV